MAAAYQPLSERLQTFLECGICMEVKEMRVLPCQHSICFTCLSDICSKKDEGGQSACPFCNSHLDRKPDRYLICRVIQYFQKHQEEIGRLLEAVNGKCQLAECERQASGTCKTCKKPFCSECQSGLCELKGVPHNLTNPVGQARRGEVKYAEWKAKKNALTHSLNEQKAELIAKAKKLADELKMAENDEVGDVLEKTLPQLQQAEAKLSQLNDQLCQEKTTLNCLQNLLEGATDAEMVIMGDQLWNFEQARKIEIGECESFFTGSGCCDVVCSPAGHLLIAGEKGVNIFHVDPTGTATIIKSLLKEQKVFTVCVHHDEIVTGLMKRLIPGLTEIVIFNREYEEVCRWTVNTVAIDFTVSDGKVVLTPINNSCLKVYSMSGEALPDVLWNGSFTGIVGNPSGDVVFADRDCNKVYKKRIVGSKKSTVWTADVGRPFSLCVDSEGFIWISTGTSKFETVTILSAQGKKVQEIKHDKLSTLTKWAGIRVHDGYLYVAHGDGVWRFKLTYI